MFAGVDLVVSGHSHIYQRTGVRERPIYAIVGGGGGRLENRKSGRVENYKDFYQITLVKFHYVRIKVTRGPSNNYFEWKAVDLEGNTMDSFTLLPQ